MVEGESDSDSLLGPTWVTSLYNVCRRKSNRGNVAGMILQPLMNVAISPVYNIPGERRFN
jgi:hypothetical protein